MVAGGVGASGLLDVGSWLIVLLLVTVIAVVLAVLIVLCSSRLSETFAWLLFIALRRDPDDRLPERPGAHRSTDESGEQVARRGKRRRHLPRRWWPKAGGGRAA